MKKKRVVTFFCILLVFALCFGDLIPMLGRVSMTAFADETHAAASDDIPPVEQSEGVVRPEDLDEGLSLNSLDDIRGRRVTVRQPIMEVLEDDILRTPAEVMSDVYQMRDLETGEVMHRLAAIDFGSDPALEAGNKDHPMYPMRGLERSPKDEDGNVTDQPYFSEFTKYMLLRQAYYFNTHVNEIIQKGELKKHPAADFIYGKISDEARAVRMRIVTDPIYRSPMTTGLYLVPGETATVKIKGLKAGETLSLYTHHQDTFGYLGYKEDGGGFGKMEDYLAYWDERIIAEAKRADGAGEAPDFEKLSYGLHAQWQWQNQKVPCMGTTFNIVGTGQETEVKIGSMYGGPLYIKPTSGAVELEISGAVLTPHFVLGVTSVEEFDEQLRKAPGLIATLDVENGQLIGPAEDMRKCDDIEKLAYFWHSVFAIDISLNGRAYNYNMTMCYDLHVPAGEAVALNSNFCAQPEYWFPICMNYETLTTKGNWGTFHELGHVQAKTHGVNWGFCDGDGEVWNNTLILLIYSMLCNMDSRVIGVEHGEYVHPYTAVLRSQSITEQYIDKTTGELTKITDYGQINEGNGAHFDQLSMYATLLHSFGSDKFVDMFYTYKVDPSYCDNKRADFVYRIGVVDRVNILDWVNENYFANISDDMFSASQLEFLRNLPKFVPVAYYWANGIDGNETARKYDVDGKNPTVFDLGGANISSPEHVDILEVTPARHGSTRYDVEAQRVTYTPPATATEYDSFDIVVRTNGGRRVALNVNMRLVYRGMYGEVWDLGTKEDWNGKNPTLAQAMDSVKDRPCDYTLSSPYAGVEFNRQNMEYLHLRLKYRVPLNGSYHFYAKADDVAEVRFYESELGGRHLGTVTVAHDTTNFLTYPGVEATLNEGSTVYIDIHLVNWGGKGHVTVGVQRPDLDDILALPVEQLLSAGVEDDELAIVDSFKGWQPRFTDSIKDATIDYQAPNNGWEVLVAPENEGGNGKENLVDGNEGTIFHSKYNGYKAPMPHVFVIDVREEQTFNYFEFVRRTNGNDKLLNFELYSCAEDEYESAAQGAETRGWTELFKGASANINAARQRISFPRTEIRYFKFIVTSSNAGITVLKELYAGIESPLSQTVKPAKYMTDSEGFEQNSANGKLSSSTRGARFDFEFLGDGFELFADVDPTYGKANITVDGNAGGEINLADKQMFNKQVYISEELEMGVHRVSIVTADDKPFNISFINVRYGTPVAADEYPATEKDGKPDYGDITVARQFTREWKTLVKDYKTLTSIKFATEAPQGYNDTFVRIDSYIRLYREGSRIAFVYPGKILAPIECGSLFAGCEALSELELDNFDTSFMRGAMNMFYGCSSLGSLDLTKFATQNTLSLGRMFANCSSLQNMDMSSFRLDENANIYRIFENCTALKTITLPVPADNGARSAGEDDGLLCELPYVYQDTITGEYAYRLRIDQSNAGHVLRLHDSHTFGEPHEEIPATCEDNGTRAYKTCTACRCDFDASTGKTLYREGELVIPATGHDEYPLYSGKSPTCTESGGEYTIKCNTCGKELSNGGVTPATGHWYELDLDAEEGNGKGYKLDYAGDGKAVVTVFLRCGTYDWNLYYEKGEMVKCGHATEVVITVDFDSHQEETCSEDEFYSYDCVISTQTLLDAVIHQDKQDNVEDGLAGQVKVAVSGVIKCASATGHSLQNVEAIPATCTAHGSTAGKMCSVCGYTEGVNALEPLGHHMQETDALAPTCTTAGHSAGEVCTRCGALGAGVETITPLDHDFSIDIAEEAPTCIKVGHTAGKKCSRCEAIEGCDIVDDLGHDEEIIEGRAPTETQSGLTDGKRCARCGEILQAQEEIPALGGTPSLDGKPAIGKVALIGIIVGSGAALAIACVAIVITIKRRRR